MPAAQQPTPRLKWNKPADREPNLETLIQERLGDIDRGLGDFVDVSLASATGNFPLTATQAQYPVVRLTGNPSGAVTIQIPHSTGALAEITFVNACGGSFSTVTIKSTGANSDNAAGVVLQTGDTRKVRHNANSVFPVTNAVRTSGAWPYTSTPTPTAGSGAFTAVSASIVYTYLDAKTIAFRGTVVITTNGTAAGYVFVPLPFVAISTRSASGRIQELSQSCSVGIAGGGTPGVYIHKYDGTYPGASSRTIDFDGVVEIA